MGSEQSALTEGDACARQNEPRSRHVVEEQCLFRGMDAPPARSSENLGNLWQSSRKKGKNSFSHTASKLDAVLVPISQGTEVTIVTEYVSLSSGPLLNVMPELYRRLLSLNSQFEVFSCISSFLLVCGLGQFVATVEHLNYFKIKKHPGPWLIFPNLIRFVNFIRSVNLLICVFSLSLSLSLSQKKVL